MASSTLHVAMIPWFAIGHITPYVHLANKLAEQGHRVSFFLPTKTQKKFNHLNLHPDLFKFIPLTVYVDGYPDGTETMADVSLDQLHCMGNAFDLTQDQVEISLSKSKADFIFYDFAYWVPSMAKSLGIISIFFCISSVVPCVNLVPSVMERKGEWIAPPEAYPGSSSVKPPPYELKGQTVAMTEYDGQISLVQRFYTSMRDSEAMCFKGCWETDGPFLEHLESQYNKPVLSVGPLLEQPLDSKLEKRWTEWLGGFENGSVVYCAFGSECILEKKQFQELVLGLELSGLPFLVRLKPPAGCETVEEALPEGFKDRVRERGVIHGGWVQQQLILSQPSVGCFVTHCGYGSMMEALASHCQIVMVPHFTDQFNNSKFMSKKLKVGVEVERRYEDGWFSRESVSKTVELVMDDGNEVGQQIRANHNKLRQLLVADGFQSSYINRLINKLISLCK